jgi:hypothetical protein
MRYLALFPVLGAITLALSCGASERTTDAQPSTNAMETSPTAPIRPAAGGADAVGLEGAAPLSDEELDRMLDALEQQIDKK